MKKQNKFTIDFFFFFPFSQGEEFFFKRGREYSLDKYKYLRENSIYTLKNSLNPFYTYEIYPILYITHQILGASKEVSKIQEHRRDQLKLQGYKRDFLNVLYYVVVLRSNDNGVSVIFFLIYNNKQIILYKISLYII